MRPRNYERRERVGRPSLSEQDAENPLPKKVPKPYAQNKKFYCEEGFRLSRLGLCDNEICDYLDVARASFYVWKKECPDFADSLKRGRAKGIVDASEFIARSENDFAKLEFLKHKSPDWILSDKKVWFEQKEREMKLKRREFGLKEKEFELKAKYHNVKIEDFLRKLNDKYNIGYDELTKTADSLDLFFREKEKELL